LQEKQLYFICNIFRGPVSFGVGRMAFLTKTISMFKNYLTIALRQLGKQKFYSAIKIGGFALGIATCLLITLYIGPGGKALGGGAASAQPVDDQAVDCVVDALLAAEYPAPEHSPTKVRFQL